MNISSNLKENKKPRYKEQSTNAVYKTVYTKPFKITL
jgi:hypothetical protein